MAVEPDKNAAPPPAEEEEGSCPSVPKSVRSSTEEIRAVAQKFADQPVQNPEPGVWGVLTAISKNSRQRDEGMNMILTLNEHKIGRCVQDSKFKIAAIAISATHCRIYRDISSNQVYIKDCSTNGTYLNWTKLRKNLPAERLHHGDIISFVGPPHDDENSYAFVYRKVCEATSLGNGNSILKRHREEFISESKRQKGIGIGSADPVSLDDVRSLQRSNSDLRQQLESHVSTIETLKSENRVALTRHENEIKELKETISSPLLEQIKELKHSLDEKKKEFDSLNSSKSVLESSIKELNERLDASKQSYLDSNEIIQSQKATISELEKQLEEERNLRREERKKASEDLKSAVEKVQLESQEEIKKQNNIFQKQQKEQQEVINKLQESEKESRVLVETLRSKLEDARENLVVSDKKVRQLESQLQDEQLKCTNHKNKSEALESELKTLKSELENEKQVAREEAWAKVSSLELEVASSIRELSIEKQRFQGARERIILRETQLRAFYSTTEEISALFAKQQEQLKAMQKTLEDEENYENALDLNLDRSPSKHLTDQVLSKNTETSQKSNNDETQDLEFTSEIRDSTKGFGSEFETERVLETENQVGETEALNPTKPLTETEQMDEDTLNPTKPLTETEQMDEEETLNPTKPLTETEQMDEESLNPAKPLTETEQIEEEESLNPAKPLTETEQIEEEESLNPKPQTETEQIEEESLNPKPQSESGLVRTADLLASEGLGSWAVGTESINNEENNNIININNNNNNESCNEINVSEIAAAAAADALMILEGQASRSPKKLSQEGKDEERKLNAMIEIVDPEFGRKISTVDCDKVGYISDAETEDSCSSTDDDDGGNGNDDVMVEDSIG
ncbi:hypothetical protein LUZ60_014645 [Juncus effusus]|nr:hypothetical protein LUZ60_014645 [Juncus effusus]